RHIAACLALLALVGGSVVAPGLHQAARGIAHAPAADEAAAQTDHDHIDGEGFTGSLDGADLGLHPCLLCVPQPQAPRALFVSPASFVTSEAFGPGAVRPTAAPAAALLPIRGPPAIA